MSRIMDLVPREQLTEMTSRFKHQQEISRNLNATIEKAKAILNAQNTRANLWNATIALEQLPSKEDMQKFIVGHILRGAKKQTSYCSMIKKKCEKVGRFYNGFNSKYHTFNNLPYWFVYETFKEKAIGENITSFSMRFKAALAAFICQQKNKIQ